MTGVVLEPVATLADAREGWDELAEASLNPFATWEWVDAWWKAYGGERALALRRVRAGDGRLAAILPLYRADRGPVPLLRFVGHGAGDQLGPICAPADRELAARALRDAAAELPGRGLLLAERLPRDEGWPEAVGGRYVRSESTPVLPVAGRSWDEWLKTKSSHFRSQVRRLERKLGREHELAFRVTEDPADLDADLETMMRLHESRWREGESVAFAGPRRDLHRDFARRALERGWLRLWFADVDGRPVAASYCVRFAGSDWCYQVGRDPEWNHYRVGFVLLARTIRATFDDGLDCFRFGLGDEPYKERFAEADPELETVVLGRGPVAAAASLAAAGVRRLPPNVRRAFVRRAA